MFYTRFTLELNNLKMKSNSNLNVNLYINAWAVQSPRNIQTIINTKILTNLVDFINCVTPLNVFNLILATVTRWHLPLSYVYIRIMGHLQFLSCRYPQQP